MITECLDPRHHQQVVFWARELIRKHRDLLCIEPYWSIVPYVYCPAHAREDPSLHTSITWKIDTWQAAIPLRCTLCYQETRWEVVHELMELQRWRTGHLFAEMIKQLEGDPLAEDLLQRYIIARNQEIELAVRQYLQEERPNTLATLFPTLALLEPSTTKGMLGEGPETTPETPIPFPDLRQQEPVSSGVPPLPQKAWWSQ